MLRTGIDLIEISRIAAVRKRHGERFLHRVFTAREIELYGDKTASLAARWAAKEAVSKALGCGIGDIAWTEIEVLNDEQGMPQLTLSGHAAQKAKDLGLTEWALSLSHTREHAIAVVVAQD